MKRSELKALSQLNRDKILHSLKRGRIEEPLNFLKTEFQERQKFHDLYVDWVNELTALLAEKAGDEAVLEFYEKYYERRQKEVRDDSKYRLPIEDLVRLRAKTFKGGGHDFNFRVEEDDEKFIFILSPCGSGGRLIERSPHPRYRTKKAQLWSHRQSYVPYYCVHCFFIWELRSTEVVGYPRAVYQIPEKGGDPCIQYMYKNPRDIPAIYFERMGKKKPIYADRKEPFSD